MTSRRAARDEKRRGRWAASAAALFGFAWAPAALAQATDLGLSVDDDVAPADRVDAAPAAPPAAPDSAARWSGPPPGEWVFVDIDGSYEDATYVVWTRDAPWHPPYVCGQSCELFLQPGSYEIEAVEKGDRRGRREAIEFDGPTHVYVTRPSAAWRAFGLTLAILGQTGMIVAAWMLAAEESKDERPYLFAASGIAIPVGWVTFALSLGPDLQTRRRFNAPEPSAPPSRRPASQPTSPSGTKGFSVGIGF